MASIRRQILQAIEATLNGLAGYTVLVNPDREPDVEEMPALILLYGPEQVPEFVSGVLQGRMTFTVEIHVTGADLETALDDAYVAAANAILADPSVGGLANDLKWAGLGEPDFVREEGHRRTAAQAVDFTVDFWTSEQAVDQQAP